MTTGYRIIQELVQLRMFKLIAKSDGITKQEAELLLQSIEAYLYAILGSQATSKQSIISNRASSLEVGKVFSLSR